MDVWYIVDKPFAMQNWCQGLWSPADETQNYVWIYHILPDPGLELEHFHFKACYTLAEL